MRSFTYHYTTNIIIVVPTGRPSTTTQPTWLVVVINGPVCVCASTNKTDTFITHSHTHTEARVKTTLLLLLSKASTPIAPRHLTFDVGRLTWNSRSHRMIVYKDEFEVTPLFTQVFLYAHKSLLHIIYRIASLHFYIRIYRVHNY